MNTTTANETRTVTVEREFPHAPEKLWRALTQPHLIADWLMQNDFQPKVGHQFKLRAEPQPGWNGIIDCKVLVVEPQKTLSYTWESGEGEWALQSTVTLSLTATSTGTLLRMEQTGFRPEQKQNYDGAKYGWQHFLGKLDQVVGQMA
jgi:uncharacterized protein YndB with AHSA1/START domain